MPDYADYGIFESTKMATNYPEHKTPKPIYVMNGLYSISDPSAKRNLVIVKLNNQEFDALVNLIANSATFVCPYDVHVILPKTVQDLPFTMMYVKSLDAFDNPLSYFMGLSPYSKAVRNTDYAINPTVRKLQCTQSVLAYEPGLDWVVTRELSNNIPAASISDNTVPINSDLAAAPKHIPEREQFLDKFFGQAPGQHTKSVPKNLKKASKKTQIVPFCVMPGVYNVGDVYYGVGNTYMHKGKRVQFVKPETDGVNHFMMLQVNDAGGFLLPVEDHHELTPA